MRGSPRQAPTPGRGPFIYGALVFGLSIPLWIIGAVLDRVPDWVPMHLPVAALTFLCPLGAAALLARRHGEGAQLRALLRTGLDPQRASCPPLLAVAVALMPLLFVAVYLLMVRLGRPLPAPHVPLLQAPLLFAVFLIGAVCEEAGILPFAVAPLQRRWGPLVAALVVGLAWASWHIVPWLEMGRSVSWIAWWGLFTVAFRVLLVCLYNATGQSLVAPVLLHASMNVSCALFPHGGSHLDPQLAAIVTVAAAVAMVRM